MTIAEKVGQLNQLFYFTQFMKPEMVEPGIRQKRTVRFTLGAELTYWSGAAKAWVQEPAVFDLWAGADSTAPLTTTLRVISR